MAPSLAGCRSRAPEEGGWSTIGTMGLGQSYRGPGMGRDRVQRGGRETIYKYGVQGNRRPTTMYRGDSHGDSDGLGAKTMTWVLV